MQEFKKELKREPLQIEFKLGHLVAGWLAFMGLWDDAVDRSVVRHQAAERTERDFSTECPQLAVMAGISSDGTERLQRVVDKALGIFPQSHSCCDRFESRNRGLQICVSELCFPYASAHKLTCCLPFGVRLTSKRECVP